MSEHRTRRLKEAKLVGRLKQREKPVSSKWWWDPPKLIPILISLIAVGISGLSWWESHRGRLINEEINRPVLVISGHEVTETFESNTDNLSPRTNNDSISFTFKLKNTGKTTAYINSIRIMPRIINSTDLCGVTTVMSTMDGRGSFFQPEGYPTQVIPGTEQRVRALVRVPSTCSKLASLNFQIELLIVYFDVLTGRDYIQIFNEHIDTSVVELRKEEK